LNLHEAPSKRFAKPALLLLGLVALCLLGFLLSRHPEPSFAGRPLSWWLADVHEAAINRNDTEQARAENAIRAIGTNALPELIQILQAEDSPLKKVLLRLKAKYKLIHLRVVSASQLRVEAAMGYRTLGPQASQQVPELAKLLEAPSPQIRHYAAEVLGLIGSKAAVPALVRGTKDIDDLVRLSSFGALSRMHPDPAIGVPVFVDGLSDPGQAVTREIAAGALGAYGQDATNAVHALSSAMATNAAAKEALDRIKLGAALKN
jgi:HEAT repeat protein